MRRLRKSAILLSAFSFLFIASSCSKDNDDTDDKKEEVKRDLYKVETVTFSSKDKIVYFSLKDNKQITLTAEEAKNSDKWDIAFDQVNGFSNRNVSVYLTDYTKFDDVVNYKPFVDREDWVTTKEMKLQSFKQMPPVEVMGNYNPLLVHYYTFDTSSMPPKAKMDNKIRIIKTEEGKYVKLQLLGIYKNPEVPSGLGEITFKYVYLKDTGENALREGEKRVTDVAEGKLKDKLTEAEWAEVKILTVASGDLNQEDMEFIKKLESIEELDLTDAYVNVGPYQKFLKDNKNSLKKVIMPKSLVTIGQGWFAYSPNLEEVVVRGNTLEGVLDGAFAICKKLKKVTLPNSLLSLGYEAFAFSAIETFTCPEKIEEIAYGTFNSCENLKEVILPNIKSIGPKAFYGCKALKKLQINAKKAPELITRTEGKAGYIITGGPFYGLNWDIFKVYVPKGAKDAFLKGWEWEDYSQYIIEE